MKVTDAVSTRTDSNDLDLDAAALGVIGPVCERLGLLTYLKTKHLHAVMLDMVSLHANGANEPELLAFGLALIDLARTLTSHPVDEKTLERQRFEADLADDHLNGIMRIEGE